VKRSVVLPVAAVLLALGACSASGSSTSLSSVSAPPSASVDASASQTAGQASPTTVASPGVALAVGPGPQYSYAVQPQAAPGTCHYRYTAQQQPLPDSGCTPGAVNPQVTQANITGTICVAGFTATIRPPQSVTSPEKTANAASYGYRGPLGDAEYDHLISLELGGDPNDPRNLWVEPPSPGHVAGSGVNNPKDVVENQAKTLVCDGKVTLAAMQAAIATDWTTALSVVGHPNGT